MFKKPHTKFGPLGPATLSCSHTFKCQYHPLDHLATKHPISLQLPSTIISHKYLIREPIHTSSISPALGSLKCESPLPLLHQGKQLSCRHFQDLLEQTVLSQRRGRRQGHHLRQGRRRQGRQSLLAGCMAGYMKGSWRGSWRGCSCCSWGCSCCRGCCTMASCCTKRGWCCCWKTMGCWSPRRGCCRGWRMRGSLSSRGCLSWKMGCWTVSWSRWQTQMGRWLEMRTAIPTALGCRWTTGSTRLKLRQSWRAGCRTRLGWRGGRQRCWAATGGP